MDAAAGVSYAQTHPLACPACGRGFDFALWLLVDTAERPDLVERIRAGTLHDIVCPHCGAEVGQAWPADWPPSGLQVTARQDLPARLPPLTD